MNTEEAPAENSHSGEFSPYALEMDSVSKAYGTEDRPVRALSGVTIGLMRGGVTAVIGTAGAGRSTLLACATGHQTPTSGWVTRHDRVVAPDPATWAALPPADPSHPELLVADDLSCVQPLHSLMGRADQARTVLVTTSAADVAAAAEVVLFLVEGRLVDAMCDTSAAAIAGHLAALAV